MLSPKTIVRLLSLVLIGVLSAGSTELHIYVSTMLFWSLGLTIHNRFSLSPAVLRGFKATPSSRSGSWQPQSNCSTRAPSATFLIFSPLRLVRPRDAGLRLHQLTPDLRPSSPRRHRLCLVLPPLHVVDNPYLCGRTVRRRLYALVCCA